jgi:hypothetical protein
MLMTVTKGTVELAGDDLFEREEGATMWMMTESP